MNKWDLDSRVNLYENKELYRKVRKLLREFKLKGNKRNVFDVALEVICQFWCLSNMSLSFLKECGIYEEFRAILKGRYPESHNNLFLLYENFMARLDLKGVMF